MSKKQYGIIESQVADDADIMETALILRSKVGRRCMLGHGSMLCYSEMGDLSYMSSRSKAYSCTIGRFSSISWNVSIGPANHDYHRMSSHSMLFASRFGMIENASDRYYNQYDKETVIGNDVWIGCNAVIMRGVHIGDGAIIGANSVITKDVPPFSIWGGVNRFINQRFSDEIIDALLEVHWWNFPIEFVKEHLDLIASEPTKENIEKLRDHKLLYNAD